MSRPRQVAFSQGSIITKTKMEPSLQADSLAAVGLQHTGTGEDQLAAAEIFIVVAFDFCQ